MEKENDAKDPIRVLQVLDKFSIDGKSIHGVARVVSWWARAIDDERFDLNILSLRGRSPAGAYVEDQGGRVFYSDRGKLNPLSIFDILKTARQTNADVLHLHGYKACTLGRIIGVIRNIPVILHEHGAYPSVPVHQRIADWLLAPLGDKTIVVSEAVAEFCVEHRSIHPDKIETIRNGIPLDEFRNVPEQAVREAADELVDHSAPTIGAVARLDEEKGITYLLEAIPAIQAEIPAVKVLIVGEGSLRSELEAKAEQMGIAEDVIFTGERRDVPRLYKLMDVKVISSMYEGIPLTLFEAMATGTPVVATKVGGIGEVIEDGENGMLVQPRKPKDIAEAVIDLLKDGRRRRDIAARAQEDAQKYGMKATMRRIEEIYREMLN